MKPECDTCDDTGLYDACCRPQHCTCGAWERRQEKARLARVARREQLLGDIALIGSALAGHPVAQEALERVSDFCRENLHQLG